MTNIRNKIPSKNRIILLLFIILFFTILDGCTRYATQDELLELEKMKIEVYNLEKEVKELKYLQLEVINEKAKILRELEDCKKSKSLNETKD